MVQLDAYLDVDDMNGSPRLEPGGRVIEVRQRRKPLEPHGVGVLARREERVARRVVVDILAVHRIFDDPKTSRVVNRRARWPTKDAHDGREAVCRRSGPQGRDGHEQSRPGAY